LLSFLQESDASVPNPSINHGTETDGFVPIHFAEQVQQQKVLNCYMKLSVDYVSGFIARRVLVTSTAMTVHVSIHNVVENECFHIFPKSARRTLSSRSFREAGRDCRCFYISTGV